MYRNTYRSSMDNGAIDAHSGFIQRIIEGALALRSWHHLQEANNDLSN